MTCSQEKRKPSLTAFVAQQTAQHQMLVRWGFKDEVETLIRAAYRLGYAKGKESRRG